VPAYGRHTAALQYRAELDLAAVAENRRLAGYVLEQLDPAHGIGPVELRTIKAFGILAESATITAQAEH
jgi:hypothetical protein